MNDRVAPVRILSADQVRTVLTAATAAPSLHNSQPWRFHCSPESVELFADPERAIPVADPDGREMLLACGAALLNLRVAIRALGVYPDVRLYPDPARPELLAVVRPQGRRPATAADLDLAEAIPRRRTNRRPFTTDPVPLAVRNQLRKAAEAERAWLAVLRPPQLPIVRAMLHSAHRSQLADPRFTAEWSFWTGREGNAPDGVPVRSGGPLPEPQDVWVLRDFSAGHGARRAPGKDFESDPLILVVGSFHDQPLARLQAGQAMQRVLLTATTAGLSASFLSQLVEVPTARKELRDLIGGGLWPQAVLRVGHGSPVPATPRRALTEVLVEPETAG